MPYEQGMSIQYDFLTKKVTVVFRGTKMVLPGAYETETEGRKAGEDHCRQQGWTGR